jgi:lysophospholipase L1-like esterase
VKPLKLSLFWILQLAIVFGLVEAACYFFLKTSTNPLYRARRILQENEIWGWQTKPFLNTEFENTRVITDRFGFRAETKEVTDLEKVELLTLGPSSAFGWGVSAEETYTAIVAKELNSPYLNASQIGFSTLQGLLLWQNLLQNELPNLKYVILSYGINDLDKFRFYDLSFSDDLSYFKNRSKDHGAGSFGSSLNVATTLELFKSEAFLQRNCSSLADINQRLTLQNSKLVLKNLINELRKRNVKVIVVNSPYQRMPVNKDFKYETVEKLYAETEQAAASGNCEAAFENLKNAKSLEPWRVEYDVVMLSILQESLSKEENLIFVDAHAEFEKLPDQKDYFIDPVHPSASGHNLIAKDILSRIK